MVQYDLDKFVRILHDFLLKSMIYHRIKKKKKYITIYNYN